MLLSVVGAGLGRTGTMSLKLALERVGFGPCSHMKEVFEHLDADVPMWDRAANGEGVDWDALFDGYRAGVDRPVSSFYRELAEHYATAKVILTVRNPNRWFQSFSETILHPLTEPLPDHLAAWGTMVRKAILDRIFGGNVMDRAHVIACYERHNEEVAERPSSRRPAVAQREAEIQTHRMPDDLGRELVACVSDGLHSPPYRVPSRAIRFDVTVPTRNGSKDSRAAQDGA